METFFLGKKIFFKRGWSCYSDNTYGRVSGFLWPWLRVKTTKFVKGSKSHSIPGTMTGRVNSRVAHDGMTHYVGDDCPEGHREDAKNEAEIGTPNPTGESIRGTELNDAR